MLGSERDGGMNNNKVNVCVRNEETRARVVVRGARMWAKERAGGDERRRSVAVGECVGGRGVVIDKYRKAGGGNGGGA